MVKAWYMDNENTDQRLEHHRNPPEFISIEDLYKKTGIEYFKLNVETFNTDGVLEKLKKERGYSYEDQITVSKDCLPNYEDKLKAFYKEHLHTDEEIRFAVEGSGYFDIRDDSDQWIRILVTPGDLIIIPSGSYHRFTVDTNNYLKAYRYFVGEPVWLPYNRPADDMDCRKEYLHKLQKGFGVAA
ncbi:PREDICTED: 1,2-dihydroxy-3-keto-5-methylthiopentene dioxygenase-like [Papilio polytes]|uniref:1,2-dihydroxy-3-keto-5-methylthiopentene dioxygenase-like n=1 Tax=Papilio polytes TaxID=76194 RepID=UPI000675CE8D|nr:PREDICTED: 1,2-dihydroxy-3-keto-5-methylthiopentene dioxygenase-like [Papilio polytes]